MCATLETNRIQGLQTTDSAPEVTKEEKVFKIPTARVCEMYVFRGCQVLRILLGEMGSPLVACLTFQNKATQS